ncbi:hypothetical protein XENTR_v10021756 [Xenopus tropicalis]|nr:hypothetical protein XENTR_v10021756 [Xenopus tropicalis]
MILATGKILLIITRAMSAHFRLLVLIKIQKSPKLLLYFLNVQKTDVKPKATLCGSDHKGWLWECYIFFSSSKELTNFSSSKRTNLT